MDEIRRGDEPIITVLKRGIKGLQVTVRIHPVVEEFFRIASADDVTPVVTFGRLWTRIGEGDLEVYEIPPSMVGVSMLTNRTGYRLDLPGRELVKIDHITGAKTVNMAFIRMKGASEGITFQVSGVFSADEIDWLGDQITAASQAIYAQYIKAMEVSCSIIDDIPPRQVSHEIDLRVGTS